MKLGTVRKQKAFKSDSCTETMIAVNGEGNRAMQNSYGFVSFFEEAVRWIHWIKANDEKGHAVQERFEKELGLGFKNLPPGEKSKNISQSHRVEKVADEEAKFLTRCGPYRFAAAVGQLTDE